VARRDTHAARHDRHVNLLECALEVELHEVAGAATNPARIFGLYPRKGTVEAGSDADLCLFDPNARRTLTGADLHSAADLELLEGTEVTGWPAFTISRGEIVYERGSVVGRPGRGQFVPGDRILP
jgi:dihydropyrimidinase